MITQLSPGEDLPRYQLPQRLVMEFLWAVSTLRPRSFAHDAQVAVTGLHPAMEVLGAEHIPLSNPCLVVCNHYSRPGFDAWWLTFAISAAIASRREPGADVEVRWVMTAAWRFPDGSWRSRVVTPFTHWAFERVARVYGFVTMPPMPPAPHEVDARAAAVLRTLRFARCAVREGGMIGLAPEGRDFLGELGEPPKGVGTFIALLVEAGLPVLPVGFTERGGCLRVRFGSLFVPQIPLGRAERDVVVTRQVMASIERQLQ